MLRAEKYRIGEIIKRIINDDFGMNDVRMLFMDLRPYAGNDPIFLEYADFVAHPDRKQGLIHQALEYFANKARYMGETWAPEAGANVTKPFPKYFKEMFDYVAKRTDLPTLKSRGLKQNDLHSFIKNQILTTPGVQTCEFSNHVVDRLLRGEKIPELAFLFTWLNRQDEPAAISQKEIAGALFNVLDTNKVHFDQERLTVQFDKIMVFILTNLHKSTYKFPSKSAASCLVKGLEYEVFYKEKIPQYRSKYLYLGAQLEIPLNDPEIPIPMMLLPVIMTTDLLAQKWCAPEVFYRVGNSYGGSSDHDFIVENFKIKPMLPHEGDRVIVDMPFNFLEGSDS